MLRYSLTVARIGGIPIRFHWSWLVVLLLVVALLSDLYASVGGDSAWPTAVAATLLMCLSIVLHELGHGLLARCYRRPVRAITLFALGGVTEIGDERPDPIPELLIAVAGPAVSLLLTLGFALAWWLLPGVAPGALALHLALINGLMVVFNLLPAYPLDGGRVLRAVIWFLTDEALSAARIAALVGRVCGWLMILFSVCYLAVTRDLLNAVWVGGVGYFLTRSAVFGYRQLVLQHVLSNVSVADLMQRAYRAVAPELSIDQFVGGYVLGQVEQSYPVLQRPDADAPQPLLGMMTLRDLRRVALKEWAITYVSEAMTPVQRVRAVAPSTSAGEAFRALMESGEEQLPVVDGQALQGVLRRGDMIRFIQMRASARSKG